MSIPVQSYKVQDEPTMTKAYINGGMTLSGRFNEKHSVYVQANITQSSINPTYYNTVVRQDDEVTGSKGNADLKTVRQAYALCHIHGCLLICSLLIHPLVGIISSMILYLIGMK